MRAGIRISSLVPSGLVIESVSDSSDSIILAVRSQAGMAECPLCGARSRRIHSRYHRDVADLPSAGKQVRFLVITRQFVCEEPHCRRRTINPELLTRAERRRKLSGHGAKEAHRKSRSMDRYRQREPDRVFCEWHHSRQGRRSCRPHRALVEWPDRRADHEAKAGKTPDVWTGEDRPPASPAARRHLVTQTSSKLRQSHFWTLINISWCFTMR
jgi:hypothetical protein